MPVKGNKIFRVLNPQFISSGKRGLVAGRKISFWFNFIPVSLRMSYVALINRVDNLICTYVLSLVFAGHRNFTSSFNSGFKVSINRKLELHINDSFTFVFDKI